MTTDNKTQFEGASRISRAVIFFLTIGLLFLLSILSLPLTGYGDEKTAVEMMKKGALDYIVKEENFIDLIPTLLERVIKEIDQKDKLKKQELEIKNHNKLLNNIISNLPNYISWKDNNFKYLGCNINYAKLFKLNKPANIVGKTDYDLGLNKSDIKLFRTTSEKSRFQTIIADIENLCQGGRVAEVFPKLLVVEKVLHKIVSMGMINEEELRVALKCTGKTSPLRIARELAKSRNDVNNILHKLEQLDIVNF